MLKNKCNFIIGFIVGAVLTGAMGVFAYNSYIEATYNNIKIKLNDNYIDTGTDEPFIANGRTYIPARYVAQAMGGDVSWDAENNTVNINTSYYLETFLNAQKNAILSNSLENEQMYLQLSKILAEYLNNDNSLSDDTYVKMENNQALSECVSDVLYSCIYTSPAFSKSFSEFWTKDRAEKYKDIFTQLNQCFNIEFDGNNSYTIKLR